MRKTLTFFKWLLKFGTVETLRRVLHGEGYRSGHITNFYFHRLGGVDEFPAVKGAIKIILSHGWGGGADMYLASRIKDAGANGETVFLVTPHSVCCRVLNVKMFHGQTEREFLVHSLAMLKSLAGCECEIIINELVRWELYDRSYIVSVSQMNNLIDEILEVKKSLAAQMTYLVHDYYCVCPNYTLTTPEGTYCGLRCDGCVTMIGEWRKCFSRIFENCREVRTFSEDTKRRVEVVFPGVAFTCVPHKLLCDFPKKPIISKGETVIGVVGFIHEIKGSRIVFELAKITNLNIVVVGTLCGINETMPENIKVLGGYKREELPDIIEREGINIAFVPSVCPETFSYVTHEIIALGLPVVSFDIGAQADAIKKCDKGAVVKEISAVSALNTIEKLYDKIYA